jgi:hypothetical protein
LLALLHLTNSPSCGTACLQAAISLDGGAVIISDPMQKPA